jgi:aminopeptidase N
LATSAAEIIKFYASLLGEAPYPELTFAAVDANLPGGHSPAYLAVINQALPTTPYAWNADPVAFDDYAHFYLAHEIAHQWWGQAIGWKSYHDEWLSEGLAHYFGLLYTTSERGPDARRDLLARMRVSATTFGPAGPISLGYRIGHVTDDNRAFRSVLYNKSAVVLDMLRRFVGDDAFMNGLRRFYRTSRFQKAGTDDLRQAIEAESHQSLTRFFDKWVMGTSMPELRVRAQVAASGDAVNVHVEQIGDVFDLPITVRVEHTDGTTEEINLPVTKQTEDVRVPVKGAIRRVTVDQDLTLARFRD